MLRLRSGVARRLPAARLCTNRPGPSDPDFAEEEMSFLHRSMYPKRERILYSLANALHEQTMTGEGTRLTPADLRTMCYRGTKLPEEDIELLLKSSSPAPDAAGGHQGFRGERGAPATGRCSDIDTGQIG